MCSADRKNGLPRRFAPRNDIARWGEGPALRGVSIPDCRGGYQPPAGRQRGFPEPIFRTTAALRRAGVSPPYGENRNPSAHRTPQFFIMIIGLNKQLRFFASVRITLSLRASPQTGVAIRFPSCSPFFQKYLENCDVLETDCRVARLPRNDSAGRNPVIKIRMLTKTDSHKKKNR